MTARGKVKKLVTGVLGAVVLFFIFAPFEFFLTAVTSHPWRMGMGLAILLALFVWLLRAEYEDEPEESAQV
jgi:hypothetical protein